MKTQSPDRNNPSNPLSKVAALTLRTIDKKVKRFRSIRVVASLNFKVSNDMRGATTSLGNQIAVNFALGIKRASFELSARFEGDDKVHPVIGRVAFLSPLVVQGRVRRDSTVSKTVDNELGISGRLGLDLLAAAVKGRIGIGGKKRSKQKSKSAGSIGAVLEQTNVAVTHGGDSVHWELSPSDVLFGAEPEQAFLQGEVFRTRKRKAVDACTIGWRPEGQKGPLVIEGSVFVRMDDLVVSNISFEDESGEVEWGRLDKNLWGKVKFPDAVPLYALSNEKERMLKQIIRKHLVTQGMRLEGARLEICRAFV